jgi:ribonuclease H / adenosylcobalamin/alpha-ribazole phosphatase
VRLVYLVRHGESEANAADREGRARPDDWDRLSDVGRAQARSVGERLRGLGVERVIASPLIRAQQTAQEIAAALGGVEIEVDEDLHEVRQGDAFDATAPHAGDAGQITWMRRHGRHHREPGAESFQDIVDRVERVQARLVPRLDAGEQIACVTHWGLLHYVLGATMFGAEFSPEHLPALYRVSHQNTGISVFEHRGPWELDGHAFDGWVLQTWNDRGHL